MHRVIRVVAVVLALAEGGCVVAVRERRPPPPQMYCAGWIWVPGHYGPRGSWHQGHWRCD